MKRRFLKYPYITDKNLENIGNRHLKKGLDTELEKTIDIGVKICKLMDALTV
jgi:hypothetical protein